MEKKTYIEEIAHLKLCYEGKTLRFHEMSEKLKAEKAHKEAIKEEHILRNQALYRKIRQQKDLYDQEQMRAYDREKVLVMKLEDLKDKVAWYERQASLKLIATSKSEEENNHLQGEASGEQNKTKKRKGWKKYINPSHWGRK